MLTRIINKINLKKFFLIFLLGVFIFGGIFSTQVSMAEEGNVQEPNSVVPVDGIKTQTGQMKELGGLGGVIVWIGSKILLFAAAGVDFAIALGDGLIDIKAVRTGWNVVLQFTNLGFVLAIIVIAFATILRIESYGMKKTLLKLVTAALLVNFSLVIAGAFISMSATVSDVFIKSALGDNGTNLSVALGNAIQPQKLGQVQERDAGWWDKLTNALNYFFEYLAGLFFVIVFTFLAALAFLTLFIMLLVRVIALMILLIVAPIVWLLWIFPATAQYWKQWWSEFLRWNFFAPIVLFFVYLAVATAAAFQTNDAALKDPAFEAALTKSQAQYSAAASVNKTILNPKLDSVSSSNSEEGFFGYAAQLLVVLGMLYGGIYVANKFSIYGGNLGVDIAQSTGKGAGAWMGRKSIALGTRPFRGELGQKWTEKLQKTGLGRGRVGRLLTSPIRQLGGLGRRVGVQQGDKMIKEAEGRLNKRFTSDKELGLAFSTLSRDEQVAAVKRLTKNKKTHFLDQKDVDYIKKSGMGEGGYLGAKRMFDRHGAANVYEDFEKAIGSNREMAIAAEKYGKGSAQHIEASENFHSTFDKEDWNNIHPSSLTNSEHGNITTENLLKYSAGSLPKILPKIKGKNIKEVTKQIKDTEEKIVKEAAQELDEIIKSIDSSIDIGAAGLMNIDKKLEWIKEKDENKYNNIKDEYKRVPEMRKSIKKHFGTRFFEAEEKLKEKEGGEEEKKL